MNQLNNDLEQARADKRLQGQIVVEQQNLIINITSATSLSIEMTGFGTWSDKAIRASPTSFSQSGTTMESEGRGNNSEQPASANDDQFPDVH
ncbi:hypothetical protein NC651_031525 [Populus alba x Populus x berolinensis]|nr:hypothetical protein NC651_031525 [Populus alba x Populus x berolinensis]